VVFGIHNGIKLSTKNPSKMLSKQIIALAKDGEILEAQQLCE
jgi:hypothetical protein